jgi:L-2-hydroxyglutarate oxidase LhgO
MLYQYRKVRNFPFNKCGKLLIANKEDEKDELITLENNAQTLQINYSFLHKKILKKKNS